jgi:hypothetical protein
MAAQKNGGFHFPWKPPLTFSPVAVFSLRYCSALKEMNNDRNHRKQQ